MRMRQLLARSTGLVGLVAVLFLVPAPAYGDDPMPMDPTLSTSGPSSGNPVVATDEAWDQAVALIDAMYGDTDYQTTCYYALMLFNLLPPDAGPSTTACAPPSCSPPPSAPPCQPACPPPSSCAPVSFVATPDQWAQAWTYIVQFFPPGLDQATFEYYALPWFSLTPPACSTPACPPTTCPPPYCPPPIDCPPPPCPPASCPPPACPTPNCPPPCPPASCPTPACPPASCPPPACPSTCPPPACPPPCCPPPCCPPPCCTPPAIVATPDQWAQATAYVALFYPGGVDEATLEMYCLSWFNLLPPECGCGCQ